ncbi:MAG: BatD family protein, partial [Flavobacteriales bacterium]|nr:BatD family protein [Flavobacteriales bacterium]
DAPKLAFPPDVESYDPKVEDHIAVTGGGMSGSRSFKYLIIPRHEGDITLGPYSISYYDIDKDRYEVLNSEPIAIHVDPGSGNASAQLTRPSKETVEMLDHDIRYLRTGDLDLRERGRFLYGSWAYISGMAAPVLALLLFMGWRRQREARAQDVTGQRRRRADRVARQRLKEAEQALSSDDREQFYAAMTKALQGYLADRFGLGVAEVTPEVIGARLADRSDGQELSRSVSDLIATCEMARYAPIEGRPRKDLYDEAVRSIRQIENA